MKRIIRLVILFLIIFFGIIAIKTTYDQHAVTFLDDWAASFVFYILICLGIISFLIEQHYYFATKNWKEFMVTAVAAIFCIAVSLPLIKRDATNRAATIFEVYGHTSAHSIRRFEFKDNKRFRLIEGQGMSSVLYYGAFSKEEDTIRILESNYTNTIKLPTTGVIKNDTVFWDNSDTMKLSRPATGSLQ